MQVGDFHRIGGRWHRHDGYHDGIARNQIMPEDWQPGEHDWVHDTETGTRARELANKNAGLREPTADFHGTDDAFTLDKPDDAA